MNLHEFAGPISFLGSHRHKAAGPNKLAGGPQKFGRMVE